MISFSDMINREFAEICDDHDRFYFVTMPTSRMALVKPSSGYMTDKCVIFPESTISALQKPGDCAVCALMSRTTGSIRAYAFGFGFLGLNTNRYYSLFEMSKIIEGAIDRNHYNNYALNNTLGFDTISLNVQEKYVYATNIYLCASWHTLRYPIVDGVIPIWGTAQHEDI